MSKQDKIMEVCEYLLRGKVWGDWWDDNYSKEMTAWVKKLRVCARSNMGANIYDDLVKMRENEDPPTKIKRFVESMARHIEAQKQ